MPQPTKAAIVPDKTGDSRASVPQSKVQGASVENTVNPLSQNFTDNLKRVYGDRVMEKVGTGSGFGYIVE